MHDTDRLVVAGGHVGVGRGPAGLLRRLPLQLQPPLRGGVRLARQQPRQDLLRFGVTARRPAHPLPRHRVNLPVNRQERRRLHHLAVGEPQRHGAPAEPPARRLSRLGRVDVVPARRPLQRRLLRLAFEHVARVEPRFGTHPDGHRPASPRAPRGP